MEFRPICIIHKCREEPINSSTDIYFTLSVACPPLPVDNQAERVYTQGLIKFLELPVMKVLFCCVYLRYHNVQLELAASEV